MKRLFTSESVTEGHPDKVCDKISDSILDAILEQDKTARVACETCCNTGFVMVMGEITTSATVDIPSIVRKTVVDIGYDSSELGFDGNTCAVMVSVDKQSADIAMGVDNSAEKKSGGDEYDLNGAGDQGMMFGFASDETPDYMPSAIYYAHKLTKKLTEVRKNGTLPYLRPDGKSQVTVEYDDDKLVRIEAVVISNQHDEYIDNDTLRADIKKYVIDAVLPSELLDDNTKIWINPTGRFVIGGPAGDSGLTGRKIIVDSYGGYCPHGGGAFSGKDPTKVDRSAAYMARHIAKNIVAAGLARRCEMDIAYAIGVARPVSVQVRAFGTSEYTDSELSSIVKEVFDLRPTAIIDYLDLRRPIFKDTTNYGHFGRDGFTWEKLNKVDELKAVAKSIRK